MLSIIDAELAEDDPGATVEQPISVGLNLMAVTPASRAGHAHRQE